MHRHVTTRASDFGTFNVGASSILAWVQTDLLLRTPTIKMMSMTLSSVMLMILIT